MRAYHTACHMHMFLIITNINQSAHIQARSNKYILFTKQKYNKYCTIHWVPSVSWLHAWQASGVKLPRWKTTINSLEKRWTDRISSSPHTRLLCKAPTRSQIKCKLMASTKAEWPQKCKSIKHNKRVDGMVKSTGRVTNRRLLLDKLACFKKSYGRYYSGTSTVRFCHKDKERQHKRSADADWTWIVKSESNPRIESKVLMRACLPSGAPA